MVDMLTLTMVQRKSEMDSASSEGPKLSRAETELRKCLSSETDEILLKGYACAWQKEILVQGHLYITAHHLCFYSSILTWETKVVIKVSDITRIKKDKTAHLFPNAITISTGEKKYGFSTFAHRNKTFNVLHLVWQNAISEQPVPQEQLSVRVKLLKKSKSVESSPATTPKHPKKPVWQLSLRGTSRNGLTDSDSSETDSPLLLSRTVTPSPPHTPSPSTTFQPLLANGGVRAHTPVPSVTVTTDDSVVSSSTTDRSHAHQLGVSPSGETYYTSSESTDAIHQHQNSCDSSFTDATDGQTQSQQSEISDDAFRGMMGSSSTNTSDSEELEKPHWRTSLSKKFRSPSVIGLAADISEQKPQVVEDEGMNAMGTGEGETERGGVAAPKEPDRGTSALQQILSNVRIHHPTRIGLLRVQAGLQDWCTPSNFINLLIVISIFLLLISTASMICRLSYVSPTFQPLLTWQPWCKLCSECGSSKLPPNGMVTVDDDVTKMGREEGSSGGGLWTIEHFEHLVEEHANDWMDSLEIDTGTDASHSRLDDLNSKEDDHSALHYSQPTHKDS